MTTAQQFFLKIQAQIANVEAQHSASRAALPTQGNATRKSSKKHSLRYLGVSHGKTDYNVDASTWK